MDRICYFSPEQSRLYGDLPRRINLNYSRLESRHYRPEHIFCADKSGWPADWEGRTILALVKLKAATGREPAYLRDILKLLPCHLNSKGYMGPIHGRDENSGLQIFDEQQLSGHNWLLRGLLEYFLLYKDDSVCHIITNILNNLYLPLIGQYNNYPLSVSERTNACGKYDGNICGKLNNWLVSTDIGCAFMCLDALSQAYEVLNIPECRLLADEMLDVLSCIDFVGCAMQTHATLSACRGVLRLFGVTGEDRYLNFSIKLFNIYISHGMTENYANFNWFSRPDSWTEPCAVVDSWICAMELFTYTDNYFYLSLANRIYRNALCYAQRVNGGFGCDKCVTSSNRLLQPNGGANLTEAFWCCTMRGAEGLFEVAKRLCFYSLDDDGFPSVIFINMLEPFSFSCDFFDISLDCFDGGFNLFFNNKTLKRIRISCYNPFENTPLIMCGELGFCNWSHIFNAAPHIVSTSVSEVAPVSAGVRIMFGDRILGVRNIHSGEEIILPNLSNFKYLSAGSFKDLSSGHIFSPLDDMTDVEPDELTSECRQIIF